MNTISKTTVLTFGYILIAYYTIVNLIAFFADYTLYTQSYLTIINMIVVLILGVSCVWITKRKLNNLITFKEGFTAFFIMIVLGFFVNYLLQYILFNFVNPESMEVNNRILVEMSERIGRDMNLSKEEIDLKIAEMIKNPAANFSPKSLLFNFSQTVLGTSIAGLLISLTFKNKSEFKPSNS